MERYDVIIIGAGSAGLPAGMYASRYKLKNLIIGAGVGGALATSHNVENYPGTLAAPGMEIMENFRKHAENSGSEILQENVVKIEKKGDFFEIETEMGKKFEATKVIFATGSKYRKLGSPGEEKFLGRGVSYCATCDGMFFRNRVVAIVGGGDTAFTEALYLAEICKEVHIIYRGDTPRAEKIWQTKAKNKENIVLHLNTEIAEIVGNMLVEKVIFKDGEELALNGVFVAIGSEPDTKLLENFGVEKDNEGFVVVDKRQETSVEGLYAAGDVTTNSDKFKQTIMSAAEGCLSAHSVHEDILKGK